MSDTKFKAQNIIRLLAGLLAIALMSCFMIKSSLSTSMVAAIIGLSILAFIIGVILFKSSRQDHQDDEYSDPVFVNETWILKR